jgi:hypothetical protein
MLAREEPLTSKSASIAMLTEFTLELPFDNVRTIRRAHSFISVALCTSITPHHVKAELVVADGLIKPEIFN